MMPSRALSLLCTIALVLMALPAVAGGPGAEAARYVDAYGLANPDEVPRVGRAERLFARLKRVSDQIPMNARLLVIDSTSKPWAIALADNTVVLSRGALDIVYRDGDEERGDAELAFVLGHELAHLGTRDLWHQVVHASLAGSYGDGDAGASLASLEEALARSSLDLAAWRDRELRADELGFVFAALGGYPVERLLGDGAEQSDFLSVWVSQTRAEANRTHYGARERTAFLRQRLAETVRHIESFDMGVRLAHFGRHADALVLFEEFDARYSSSAVLSNIGYVLLQLARESMPEALAYRFWMPTLLETDSGLRVPSRSLDTRLPEKARVLLERAVEALSSSLRIDERDVVTRMNLIVAHWYLGKLFHARAVVEDALEHRPNDVQLLALRSLVLLEQEPEVDMAPRVIEILESLAADPEVPVNVSFNLARLLDERRRVGRASVLWKDLLLRLSEMPDPYARIVCARAGVPERCESRTGAGVLQAVASELFAVRPGMVLTEIDRTISATATTDARRLRGLDVTHLSWGGNELFAIGGIVELAVARPGSDWSVARLVREFDEPRVTLPSGGASVMGFGNGLAALVRGDVVEELWTAR